jgi:glutamate synthase (NADPH/NADH) small chain
MEGRKLAGVHFAMEYLTASTKAILAGDPTGTPIHAGGRDVIVIGGGDTGTDCVGTAMRQSCKSLRQLEILPRPPLQRADDNPWPEWPRVYLLDYAQEEAAAKFGEDPREYVTTVKRFNGDAAGRVRSLTTVQIVWRKEAGGRPVPEEVAGSERELPADLVLLAMGFTGPEQPLAAALGLQTDPRSNIQAEHGRFATNVRGVFTAGDCRRGQSLIVWAINEGRGAARECDRFLMGSTDLP